MVSSHGCFVWYELTTTDAEAAKAFYADVVGWGLRDASMPGAAYTLFTADEVAVAGLMGLPDEARTMGAQSRWTGYVGVDDVDAATDRLRHLGGTVYVPPTGCPRYQPLFRRRRSASGDARPGQGAELRPRVSPLPLAGQELEPDRPSRKSPKAGRKP